MRFLSGMFEECDPEKCWELRLAWERLLEGGISKV